MAAAVYCRVLALAKRHVVRRFHDSRSALLRVDEVRGDVIDADMDRRTDMVRVRCAKSATLLANDNSAVANDKLRMIDDPGPFHSQALAKPKYST